jgi:hypothetical protein
LYLGGAHRPIHAAALAYPATILATAIFHIRYVRTQREFIVRPHPWRDFAVISAAEWIVCILIAWWTWRRLADPTPAAIFCLSFAAATLTRYILRKEFLQDIRGLRKTLPREAENY